MKETLTNRPGLFGGRQHEEPLDDLQSPLPNYCGRLVQYSSPPHRGQPFSKSYVQQFIAGQRWINTLESQLGLGTVLSAERRTVNIRFNATGETRTYAKLSAPLARVKIAAGDTIRIQNGKELNVQSAIENHGLITYTGIDRDGRYQEIHERELDHFIRLDRPADRLFSGQFDPDRWLELRYETVLHRNALLTSDLRGLTGCRTSLLPHQLYIAHEVGRRYAPRVLLADEVGLGKTIEAGLILHQQLITERAERVLIVVPENLIHQWLVEMIRRFNLSFSLFDESRCCAVCESSSHENPFFSEQLVLVSLDFLTRTPQRAGQAAGGNWDLLIVDEAHHLRWTPEDSSAEYRVIEKLARGTRGLLLLTGTPEKLGKASHFASLRLLDPARFHNLDAFIAEEKGYEEVATAIHALMDERALSADETAALQKLLALDEDLPRVEMLEAAYSGVPGSTEVRREMIDHLLDRHGTGRVLFRNTRATVKGFPKRLVKPYALPLPARYRNFPDSAKPEDATAMLLPEALYRQVASRDDPHWTGIDPRAEWLRERIRSLRPAKILVITATAKTVLELAEFLKSRSGTSAAVFHEQMSIVERDRAAAFFANPETGCPVLICSEIGSEGRNFQFSHDLILFDLPLNPDLLEQRIGRLDRIGQMHTVNIHIPYLQGSAQEVLYRWYQEGLDAFANTCPAGHPVFVHVHDQLLKALREPPQSADKLVESTRDFRITQTEMLYRGRGRLLEYNSCRPPTASILAEQARAQDRESILPGYMERVFDCFGVDSELQSPDCLVLHPADHLAAPFPCLPDDGTTITFNRETALAREDVQFITWDHPMVTRIMEQIGANEAGNSAFTVFKTREVKPGTLILECLYIIEAAGFEQLRANACLPPTAIRVIIDQNGKDYESTLTHERIRENQQPVNPETARQFIGARQAVIRELILASEEKARVEARRIIQSADLEMTHKLTEEINRLRALSRVNPNVRPEEIDHFAAQLAAIHARIESAPLRLDAIRVLLAI